MTRYVEGDIDVLGCKACGATIAVFKFAGDSDTATEGLLSAGTADGRTIVIGESTSMEWKTFGAGGERIAADRFQEESGVGDLHIPLLKRWEGGVTPVGVTFDVFRKMYRPPDAIYACGACDEGEAAVMEKHAPKDFVAAGGRIVLLGSLKRKW